MGWGVVWRRGWDGVGLCDGEVRGCDVHGRREGVV